MCSTLRRRRHCFAAVRSRTIIASQSHAQDIHDHFACLFASELPTVPSVYHIFTALSHYNQKQLYRFSRGCKVCIHYILHTFLAQYTTATISSYSTLTTITVLSCLGWACFMQLPSYPCREPQDELSCVICVWFRWRLSISFKFYVFFFLIFFFFFFVFSSNNTRFSFPYSHRGDESSKLWSIYSMRLFTRVL